MILNERRSLMQKLGAYQQLNNTIAMNTYFQTRRVGVCEINGSNHNVIIVNFEKCNTGTGSKLVKPTILCKN